MSNITDTALLKDGERLDDLEFGNMYIISNPDKYCYTSDSVMLANLVNAGSRDCVIDLCTGGGIIALLIAGKTLAKKVIGVELQMDMVDMAQRSVILNNMSERVEIIQGDVSDITTTLGHGSADIVVCNPPYYKVDSGATRINDCIAIARHEIKLTLEQMIRTASELCKYGGKFYMVHKSERLAEAITLLCKFALEPKSLYNIVTGDNVVDTFIIECKKGGKSGVKVYSIRHD